MNDWWVTILGTCTVEKERGLFEERLQLFRDKWVPRERGKYLECKRKTQKWMNEKICRSLKKRNQAWKRFICSPSYLLEAKYKDIRNNVSKMIMAAKANFEVMLAEKIKEDTKPFYACVKSMAKSGGTLGPLRNTSGVVVSENKGMSGI